MTPPSSIDIVQTSLEALKAGVRRQVSAEAPEMLALLEDYFGEATFGAAIVEPHLETLPAGASILEVGAGAQLLSCALQRAGFHVTALEPLAEGFSHLDRFRRIVVGVAAENGAVPAELQIPAEELAIESRFDFAFSINVMEHVSRVDIVLHRVLRALRPECGYRFVCPNYLFPYEPHFNIPTMISKSITKRVFGRQHSFVETRRRSGENVGVSELDLRALCPSHLPCTRRRSGLRSRAPLQVCGACGHRPELSAQAQRDSCPRRCERSIAWAEWRSAMACLPSCSLRYRAGSCVRKASGIRKARHGDDHHRPNHERTQSSAVSPLDLRRAPESAGRNLCSNRVLAHDFIRATSGMRVLDLGCGTAQILSFLPEGVDYWGYDVSADYIKAAVARFGARGHFRCGIPDEGALGNLAPFDLALATGVLHHLDDESARHLLRVARHALREGGRFVSIDPVFTTGPASGRAVPDRQRSRPQRPRRGRLSGARSRRNSKRWKAVFGTVRGFLTRIGSWSAWRCRTREPSGGQA